VAGGKTGNGIFFAVGVSPVYQYFSYVLFLYLLSVILTQIHRGKGKPAAGDRGVWGNNACVIGALRA
jgi:hypothetical protein